MDGLNLYAAFGNAPVNQADILGLQSERIGRISINYQQRNPPTGDIHTYFPVTGTIEGDIGMLVNDFTNQLRNLVNQGNTGIEIAYQSHNLSIILDPVSGERVTFRDMLLRVLVRLDRDAEFQSLLSQVCIKWFFWNACNTAWAEPVYFRKIFNVFQPGMLYVTGNEVSLVDTSYAESGGEDYNNMSAFYGITARSLQRWTERLSEYPDTREQRYFLFSHFFHGESGADYPGARGYNIEEVIRNMKPGTVWDK